MYIKKTLLSCCLLGAFSSLAADHLTNSDPLTPYQWHLNNIGHNGLTTNTVAGEDLNLLNTDMQGIKGDGVTVTVIDSGIELTHPDLVNNVITGSLNLLTGTVTPTDNTGHGTAVAGIIAAQANNNIGGRGVAPNAHLIGFNYLDAQTMSNWLQSHGMPLTGSANSRIYNQSYSSKPALFKNVDAEEHTLSLQLKERVMQQVSLNSNNGLGALFVKSAGNAFYQYTTFFGGTSFQVFPYEQQQPFNNAGLPFHNANLSTDNASFWNMLVSAYNANGKLASYSSVGANIFLTAPGGENAQSQAGIVTTDMSGCTAGFNTINSTIDIPLQNTGLDSHCDATAAMYGTSAAAANTSGAIALAMSANPQLDARTIKHILATTARKLDGSNAGIDINFTDANGDAVSYNAIPGWQQNAAGYNVHTFYGLGAIDIDAAVAMAQQTTALLPTLQVSDWHTANTELTIPDANVNGVQDTLAITDNLTIEAVQLKLSIDHSRMRDLAVELISPSGTRSVLLSPRTGLINATGTPVQNALLLSQHFYGESAAGQWQIRLIDTDNGTSQTLVYNEQAGLLSMNDTNNNVDGTLLSWSLRFYGH
ncbi:S8 family serine peptidase [Pseudoalteromonas aliena]|uniref:P/Homo B domain-containing protein n=1 Tax=Pseudoalteromonas aliena SW19 TaxID=1314866 RepID=A0ABR9E168_9GAMM|nr:S8 family serine peptidase [Pseudoalteromonas aliena]MBE0360346.1 hypothetical protein [Pseudoalteromonas aliena SW19]